MTQEYSEYEVAKVYWHLSPGKRKWREVALILQHPSDEADKAVVQNRLGRLARRWEELGYVRHQVLSAEDGGGATGWPRQRGGASLPSRVPHLETLLRKHFALREAVVIDTTELQRGRKNSLEFWSDADSQLHMALGQWGARVFTAAFRPGDIIGVGGGRGPGYTLQNCIFTDTFPIKRVVSLTGKLFAQSWTPGTPFEASLDADQVAHLLGSMLGTTVSPMNASLASEERRKSPKTHAKKDDVTVALVGLGVFTQGHPLYTPGENANLKPVMNELTKLCKLVTALDAKANSSAGDGSVVPQHWVGDICNRLFITATESDAWANASKTDRAALKYLVEIVNARTLTPMLRGNGEAGGDFAQTCKDGAVVMVAGGPHKVLPLLYVLRQRPVWVSHLVTDSQVASCLLERRAQTA